MNPRNVISDYIAFLWQGPGGLKSAPNLPGNLSPVGNCREQVRSCVGTQAAVTRLSRPPKAVSSLITIEKTLRYYIDKPESMSKIEKGKRNLESGLSQKTHRPPTQSLEEVHKPKSKVQIPGLVHVD